MTGRPPSNAGLHWTFRLRSLTSLVSTVRGLGRAERRRARINMQTMQVSSSILLHTSPGSKHGQPVPPPLTEQLLRPPEKLLLSPATTLRVIWCLWSLNQPGISTRHPYIPESSSSTCRMVRDTSPSSRLPSSRYRSDSLLLTDVPSDLITSLAQPLLGMAPRPQHTGSFP